LGHHLVYPHGQRKNCPHSSAADAVAASSSRKRKLKAVEAVGTEGGEGAAEAHDYASLAHQIFASLRVGGVEGVCGAVVVVVADGDMAG
jgi:hypothetical protein